MVDASDIRLLKVFKALSKEGKIFLLSVVHEGCDKDPSETVKEYLFKKGMRNVDYKSRFQKTMRDQIESSPSFKDYDITLLYACIKNVCPKLAGFNDEKGWAPNGTKVENYCTKVKNMRNYTCHGKEYDTDEVLKDVMDNLGDTLEKGYKALCDKYPTFKPENHIKKMKESLKIILASPIQLVEATQYRKEMEKLRDTLRDYVKDEGVKEVIERSKSQTNVDPASFISGRENLKVQTVFTSLEIVRENRDKADKEDSNAIDYKDMLQQKTDKGEDPSIIVIEGEAGAGKSTLAKLMYAEWAEGTTNIKGLNDYDLVLLTEFKNKFISSFGNLLTYLMPNASYWMNEEDLVRSVLALKVLLIFDGLDELNEKSKQLLQEIVQEKMSRATTSKGGKLDLLMTTRPQKLPELSNFCHGHKWVHVRILGIPSEKKAEFVKRLHEEMVRVSGSTQDTEKLTDYVKKSEARLGEHLRLPLNLALLTYLWEEDPDRINSVTTATCLFLNVLTLIKERAATRLYGNIASVDKVLLAKKIDEYSEVLYRISSDELTKSSLQLSDCSEEKLQKKCRELNLPHNELSAAFLNVSREWNASGYEIHLTAPHKSIMEFYAARCFLSSLKCNEGPDISELEDFLKTKTYSESMKMSIISAARQKCDEKNLKSVQKELGWDTTDPAKYKNVLLYIGGLLGEEPLLLEEHAEELVSCLMNARTSEHQWLDIVAETKCNPVITKHISKNINKQIYVRDGHMQAAISVFDHLCEKIPVKVNLDCEVTYIPDLEPFVNKLAKRACQAELLFNHQWKNIRCGKSDHLLQLMNKSKCRVYRFTGNLGDLECLPPTTETLHIAYGEDEQARRLGIQLKDFYETYEFRYMGVHVVPNVSPKVLSHLPIIDLTRKMCGAVWISGVGDDTVLWACEVAQALQPPEGKLSSVMFPRSKLTKDGCSNLISELSKSGVSIRSNSRLYVTSNNLKQEDVVNLRLTTKDKLGCEFDSVDDTVIWGK